MDFAGSHAARIAARFVAGDDRHTAATQAQVLALFDRYRAPLFRYLLSSRLSEVEAEEVLQEVFLALFRHLLAGKPETNLQAWLFRVAHNLGLKARQSGEQTVALEAAGDTCDRAPNPEQEFLAARRQSVLQSVYRALPPLDRQCLSLRAEGLRYREIAATLGISLGSVSQSLKRSLARLSEVAER